MTRRIGRVLGAIAMTATLATGAFASEKGFRISENWLFSMGYKLWVSAWTTGAPAFVPQGGANINQITKNGVPGHIMSGSIKYKSVFLSGSFMSTGDYNFAEFSDVIDNVSGAAGRSFLKKTLFTAKREEVDANLGYFFNPYVGMTVGYKGIVQKYNTKVSGRTHDGGATLDLIPTVSNTKTYYNGPTVGILGGAPIGKGFSVYGNLVGGFLTATYHPASTSDSAPYEGSELGFSWKHRDFPLSASLGYKLQRIETRSKDSNYQNQPGMDLTTGVTMGLNFQF